MKLLANDVTMFASFSKGLIFNTLPKKPENIHTDVLEAIMVVERMWCRTQKTQFPTCAHF